MTAATSLSRKHLFAHNQNQPSPRRLPPGKVIRYDFAKKKPVLFSKPLQRQAKRSFGKRAAMTAANQTLNRSLVVAASKQLSKAIPYLNLGLTAYELYQYYSQSTALAPNPADGWYFVHDCGFQGEDEGLYRAKYSSVGCLDAQALSTKPLDYAIPSWWRYFGIVQKSLTVSGRSAIGRYYQRDSSGTGYSYLSGGSKTIPIRYVYPSPEAPFLQLINPLVVPPLMGGISQPKVPYKAIPKLDDIINENHHHSPESSYRSYGVSAKQIYPGLVKTAAPRIELGSTVKTVPFPKPVPYRYAKPKDGEIEKKATLNSATHVLLQAFHAADEVKDYTEAVYKTIPKKYKLKKKKPTISEMTKAIIAAKDELSAVDIIVAVSFETFKDAIIGKVNRKLQGGRPGDVESYRISRGNTGGLFWVVKN